MPGSGRTRNDSHSQHSSQAGMITAPPLTAFGKHTLSTRPGLFTTHTHTHTHTHTPHDPSDVCAKAPSPEIHWQNVEQSAGGWGHKSDAHALSVPACCCPHPNTSSRSWRLWAHWECQHYTACIFTTQVSNLTWSLFLIRFPNSKPYKPEYLLDFIIFRWCVFVQWRRVCS